MGRMARRCICGITPMKMIARNGRRISLSFLCRRARNLPTIGTDGCHGLDSSARSSLARATEQLRCVLVPGPEGEVGYRPPKRDVNPANTSSAVLQKSARVSPTRSAAFRTTPFGKRATARFVFL
jgi:hypothetical protein